MPADNHASLSAALTAVRDRLAPPPPPPPPEVTFGRSHAKGDGRGQNKTDVQQE